MKPKSHPRFWRLLCLLLVPFAILIMQLARQFPWVVERYYTHGFYNLLVGSIGRVIANLPFSLGEFLILATIVIVIWYLFLLIRSCIQKKATPKQAFLRGIATLLAVVSCIYFGFVLVCGINYTRPTYAQLSKLPVQPSTVTELEQLCRTLIVQANQQRGDRVGTYELREPSSWQLGKTAQQIFLAAGKQHPLLAGYVPPTKPVWNSYFMSHMNITGVYFAFTFEANVNVQVPQYTIPATMLHELSHCRGFMQEADANYLAYLVSQTADDTDFRYSGTMLALVYSINAYYKAAPDSYAELLQLASPGVLQDLEEDRLYWKQFQTPVATVSTAVNNAYLKSNGQSAGVASYGQMVDLLLAEQRAQAHSEVA